MTDKQTKPTLLQRLKSVDTAAPLEYGIRFVTSFLLARARIFTGYAPFGVAFAAAAPLGPAGFLSAAGVCVGAFTGGIYWGFKYAAAILVVRVLLQLFGDTDAARTRLFAPLVTFGTMLIIGAVYAGDTGWALTPTVLTVVETFLAGGCTLFYHVALSPWQTGDAGTYGRTCHYISTLLLLSTVCMSLSTPMLLGILSLGRVAALLVVMFVVYRGGTGLGTVCAVAMGAAMDLSVGWTPFFTMCYSLTAMIAGIFARSGRRLFLLAFTAGSAIAVIWCWQASAMLPALYETFAASVIFLLLPESFLSQIGALLPFTGRGYGFLKAREYTRDRVELTAQAFRELHSTVRAAAGEGSEDDVSMIFDRASEQVCRNCPSSGRCWTRDYADTVDVLNNLTPRLTEAGSVAEGDFPQRFAQSCGHFRELVAAINAETRTYFCRRQYRARLREHRGAACDQYLDVASILGSLSQELGSDIAVEPALERKLQRFLRSKNVNACTAVFRVRGGRLRAELRGSGLSALTRDGEYLNRLSAVLGTRLCTSEERRDADRLVLLEAEPLCAAIGVASCRKEGEAKSGDRAVYFRTDEGVLYVLLSDGMGTGDGAAALSGDVTGTLERFLKAGVEPETALRILSDLMLLRMDEEVGSATVDLLSLNLFTGEARIYKYGAAPSYLRRGAQVRRLSCGTLPVGLGSPGGKSVSVSAKLQPGSMCVLLSDGVTASGDDRWLRKRIQEFDAAGEPNALARCVLDGALEMSAAADDMTVIAVRLSERP